MRVTSYQIGRVVGSNPTSRKAVAQVRLRAPVTLMFVPPLVSFLDGDRIQVLPFKKTNLNSTHSSRTQGVRTAMCTESFGNGRGLGLQTVSVARLSALNISSVAKMPVTSMEKMACERSLRLVSYIPRRIGVADGEAGSYFVAENTACNRSSATITRWWREWTATSLLMNNAVHNCSPALCSPLMAKCPATSRRVRSGTHLFLRDY